MCIYYIQECICLCPVLVFVSVTVREREEEGMRDGGQGKGMRFAENFYKPELADL